MPHIVLELPDCVSEALLWQIFCPCCEVIIPYYYFLWHPQVCQQTKLKLMPAWQKGVFTESIYMNEAALQITRFPRSSFVSWWMHYIVIDRRHIKGKQLPQSFSHALLCWLPLDSERIQRSTHRPETRSGQSRCLSSDLSILGHFPPNSPVMKCQKISMGLFHTPLKPALVVIKIIDLSTCKNARVHQKHGGHHSQDHIKTVVLLQCFINEHEYTGSPEGEVEMGWQFLGQFLLPPPPPNSLKRSLSESPGIFRSRGASGRRGGDSRQCFLQKL